MDVALGGCVHTPGREAVRGKVHLVGTWWCLDCDQRGETGQDPAVSNKQAEAHTTETGHPTFTHMRPEEA